MRQPFLVLILTAMLFTDYGQFQLHAQVKQEWESTYSGTFGEDEDRANQVIVDDSGNVYVTGQSHVNGVSLDYATIKYSPSGAELWVQRYNGPANSFDVAVSIASDKSGGVYVTGFSMGSGTNYDYATIKYSSAGVQEWIMRHNGLRNGDDRPTSLVVDGSNNVYVTGSCVNGSSSRDDYTTIKYSSSGVLQWLRTYDGPGDSDDEATSIALDDIGNVFVTGGSSANGSFNNYDIVTVKYSPAGTLQWMQRYDGPISDREYATSIGIDALRNVYVAGPCRLEGTDFDYIIIKYNSSGIQQWLETFDGQGSSDDFVTSMALDESGNAFVTGYSLGIGTNFDYATIRYNSFGIRQWVQTFNGTGNSYDYANSISIDKLGDVYVTGSSRNTASTDLTTIKYSILGNLEWTKIYDGPSNSTDGANSIFADGKRNVYVSGYSLRAGTNLDYVTLKYSQPTGIEQLSSNIPEQCRLLQNYPNPFNPSTKIRFDISKSTYIKLVVYDALGKVVAIPVNENLKTGVYEAEFDGDELSSGVYFYRIQAGDFVETKKMLLLK